MVLPPLDHQNILLTLRFLRQHHPIVDLTPHLVDISESFRLGQLLLQELPLFLCIHQLVHLINTHTAEIGFFLFEPFHLYQAPPQPATSQLGVEVHPTDVTDRGLRVWVLVAGPVKVDPVQLGEFVFFLVDLPEVDNVRR